MKQWRDVLSSKQGRNYSETRGGYCPPIEASPTLAILVQIVVSLEQTKKGCWKKLLLVIYKLQLASHKPPALVHSDASSCRKIDS